MAVSKRLRFEILRRDNHACRYCGATAPGVALTVDHVTPVALGGSDDPTNLVTACTDCNSGKSATPPDAQTVANVASEALKWSQALKRAAADAEAALTEGQSRYDDFFQAWVTWDSSRNPQYLKYPLPDDWRSTIDQIHSAGLTTPIIIEAIRIAMESRADRWGKFSYFCGVCWKKVSKLQESARQIVEAG